MHRTFAIFHRDIFRLLKVPTAWVVIIGISIIPALYAWINITGFWDPFSNAGHVRVAVTNSDEGFTSSTTGHVDVGHSLVDELSQNHDLGWYFVTEEEAIREVERGQSYAALVIPEHFTRQLRAGSDPLGEKFASARTGAEQARNVLASVNARGEDVANSLTQVEHLSADVRRRLSSFHASMSTALDGAGDRVIDASDHAALAAHSLNGTVTSLRSGAHLEDVEPEGDVTPEAAADPESAAELTGTTDSAPFAEAMPATDPASTTTPSREESRSPHDAAPRDELIEAGREESASMESISVENAHPREVSEDGATPREDKGEDA